MGRLLLEIGLVRRQRTSAPDDRIVCPVLHGLVDELAIFYGERGLEQLGGDSNARHLGMTVWAHETQVAATQSGGLFERMFADQIAPFGHVFDGLGFREAPLGGSFFLPKNPNRPKVFGSLKGFRLFSKYADTSCSLMPASSISRRT